MKIPRRRFLHLAAGAAVLPVVSRTAGAQTYPSRPITVIVPYPAGGGADSVFRVIAERMLQVRDRSRNVRLGGIEALRRLPHGARLHDGHEDVQVLQLHSASDAIAQLHVGPISDLR